MATSDPGGDADLAAAMAAPFVAGLAALLPAATPTFVARLRAAGVDDEPLLAALATPPLHDEDGRAAPPATTGPSRPEARAFELRRLLEEML